MTLREPQTVSRPALLDGGSDQKFRQLVSDLFTVSARMQMVRDAMALMLGVTGPQYSMLLAVHELQRERGVNVKDVAAHLHVSGAFVTVETGKLADAGLVAKSPDPGDRRRVRLTLTPLGAAAVAEVLPDLQRVNDSFFSALDTGGFQELAGLMAGLETSSKSGVKALDGRRGGKYSRSERIKGASI